LVAAGLPAAAVAPPEWVEQGTQIGCSSGTEDPWISIGSSYAPDGSVVDGGATIVVAGAEYWASQASGSIDGDSWVLDLSLVAIPDGTPAGTMRAEGDAVALGDPIVIDERFRDGNAWVTRAGTVQPLLVDGSIVAGSGAAAGLVGADLDCSGESVDLTHGGTNPATRISRLSGSGANCDFGEDGIFVLSAQGDQGYGLVALGVDEESGTADVIAEGLLQVDADSVGGTLDVVQPPDTGDSVLVALSIGDQLGTGHSRQEWPQGASFDRYTQYALTGTITLPDGSVAELQDCTLSNVNSKLRFSLKAGQKPGGKAPANDLPTNAAALAIGGQASVSTRGAAEAAEAACAADWGEVPLGRTVWYSVTGTGGTVHLSTQGSGFDTVLGVYDQDLNPLGCVDDTETGLEASMELPTESGVTYLVQVGGFAGAWGAVKVSAQ